MNTKHHCRDCGTSHFPAYLKDGNCPDCGAKCWPRVSFSALWSDKLGAEIKMRSLQPYPMEFHQGKEWEAITKAVNQGIDSYLEAIFFKQGQGSYGRNKITIESASVPVLVRRLMESGQEEAESLASGICETLGIELV